MNIKSSCNSYSRSSLLQSAPCAWTQNRGHACSSRLLILWSRQKWKLPWRTEQGRFYIVLLTTPATPPAFFSLYFLSRVPASLHTRLWTRQFIEKKLHSTAWQAATSHLPTPHRNQDLVRTRLKRSLLCFFYRYRAPGIDFIFHWYFSLPRSPSQNPQLRVLPLDCVTHSTSHLLSQMNVEF